MTVSRKNIMLGTAGHVDHGKTALVKLLTGCDTDRLAVEKQRGLTIELGFAPCRMNDERIVGIVDVPGHVEFIKNMVAGAHGVDVVILVVAANEGVMPQTREHLDVLTLMGVKHGLVALTKTDLIDEEMHELVMSDVTQFLAGTFLENAKICPVSNITGQGFDRFFTALNEAVDSCEPRENHQPFRMWIERAFSVHGFGTVACGIPTSGQISVDDQISLLPDQETIRVRGVEVYGQSSQTGRAGECAALNLANTDLKKLGRGKVLCRQGFYEPISMAEAELRLLDNLPDGIKDFSEVHFHIGTSETMAHVAILEGEKKLPPGKNTLVQIRLAQPLCISAGDKFIVRGSVGGFAGGRVTTIGGGRILGTSNKKLRRNRQWTLDALTRRREAIDSLPAWCSLHLVEARKSTDVQSLAKRAGRRVASVTSASEELCRNGIFINVGEKAFLHREIVAEISRNISAVLEKFHDENSARAGLAETELKKQLDLMEEDLSFGANSDVDSEAFRLALADLIDRKVLLRQGAVVALTGRTAMLSDENMILCERMGKLLREAGLAPPLPADLAVAIGADEKTLATLTQYLADQGTVVKLDQKVIMHRDAVEAAKKVVLELFSGNESTGFFETVEFRDRLGVSRKFAVPLLDYFDKIYFTARSGNRRRPGREAKKILQ